MIRQSFSMTDLGSPVGQTLVRQLESRASKHREIEPKECGELLHPSPEPHDFLLEFRCPQVRQGHYDLRCLAQPSTGVERVTPRSVAMVTSCGY